MEFISSIQIMPRNIFIPTLFTEMLLVSAVINDHQLTPKLRSLLALEQSLELGSAAQELYRCQLSCKCQVYNPLQSMWAMPYELDAPSVWAISQQTLEVVDHDIIPRVTLV